MTETDSPRDTNGGGRGSPNTSDDRATRRMTRRDRPRPNKGAAFKGMTAEMNGHVFQTYSEAENKNQFKNTCEALSRYVSKKLKYPGDMSMLFTSLKEPAIEEPKKLTDEERKDEFKKTLWLESVKPTAKG